MCLVFFIRSEVLGEGFEGDLAFASALDTFGGDHSDPDFMALGGTLQSHSCL